MTIKETLHLTEVRSYKNFIFILAVLSIFIISIGDVEADDDTGNIWRSLNERGQIELVLDDTAMESTDLFSDEQQQNTPEALDTGGLTVNIINGINVRNITTDGSGFGNVDRNFPRGETEVVGWFNASNSPLSAIAGGTWLMLKDGKHAVSTVVGRIETDYTVITDEEAATTQEFKFNGSIFVPAEPEPVATETPSAQPEAEVAPAAPTITPKIEISPDDEIPATPEPVETPEPIGTPEALTYPELPDEVTVTYRVPDSLRTGETITETISINQNSLLPIPLGLVPEGFSEITDSIAQYETTGTGEEQGDWARIPLSGIILDVRENSNTAGRMTVVLLTETPNGQPVPVIIKIMQFPHFRPMDSNLDLTVSQNDADLLYSRQNQFSKDEILTGTGQILEPGDHIVLDVLNTEHGQAENTPFDIARTIETYNGVSDGTPVPFLNNAIDNGEVNVEDAVVVFWGFNYGLYLDQN